MGICSFIRLVKISSFNGRSDVATYDCSKAKNKAVCKLYSQPCPSKQQRQKDLNDASEALRWLKKITLGGRSVLRQWLEGGYSFDYTTSLKAYCPSRIVYADFAAVSVDKLKLRRVGVNAALNDPKKVAKVEYIRTIMDIRNPTIMKTYAAKCSK